MQLHLFLIHHDCNPPSIHPPPSRRLPPEPPASRRSRGCRVDYLGMSTEGHKPDYLLKVRELLLSTMYERLQR